MTRFDPSLPDDGVNVSEGSALREAMLLVAGVAAVAVLTTIVIAFSIEWIVPRIPVALEQKLFSSIATAAIPTDGAEAGSDDRTIAVQALADRLSAHWSEAPFAFHVSVIDDPTPNAFALPGGVVVVTSGLLDRIDSENEIAFVLAHELGHFKGRDHLRGIGRGVAIALVSAAIGLGSDAAGFIANTASTLSSRHFDRGQESDADRFGMQLIVAEYGHAAGAPAVFERVLNSESDLEDAQDAEPERSPGEEQDESGRGRITRTGERVAGYFSTHPLGPDRIAALHAHARQRGWALEGPLAAWSARAPLPAE